MDPAGTDREDRVLGMLFLTRRCNLNCSYCHMTRTETDANAETLARFIDLLLGSFPLAELQFFGGEPLLRLDLLLGALDHVRRRWPERAGLRVHVTTNGLLLEGEVLEALLERRVEPMLSLDGSLESQRSTRFAAGGAEACHARIVANIRELARRKIPFFVNAVVSPKNVDRMEDNVRALFDAGAPTVQVAYEIGALWSPELRRRYVDALLRLKARYRDVGQRLQNDSQAEPVLGSSFFAVDVDGEAYHGCAIVLEESMPRFSACARVGNVATLGSLRGARRGMQAQIAHIRRGTRGDRDEAARLRSNLLLGLTIRRELERVGNGGSRP